MTALWQAIKPHSDLMTGMYLAWLMLGALWLLGTFVGGMTPKLISWWERRRRLVTLPLLTEVRIILLSLTVVWIVMLSVIIGSDIFLVEDWALMPFPISPE